MKLKRDTKFGEKSTYRFKIDKKFDKFWLDHSRVSKIFTLMDLFWAKYILFELKKYRGFFLHETEDGYKICRGIDSSFQNWYKEFDKIWPEHSEVSKIFILMCSFRAKYILFELKKNRGIMFHETEEEYKICRRINSSFQKSHKELDKIWTQHSKISKNFISMGSFWAK